MVSDPFMPSGGQSGSPANGIFFMATGGMVPYLCEPGESIGGTDEGTYPMTDASPPIEPLLVTLKETRRLLGLGKTTVNLLLNRGELTRKLVGRRTMVTMESLRRFAGNTQSVRS